MIKSPHFYVCSMDFNGDISILGSGHDKAPVLGERLRERPHPGDLVVNGNTTVLWGSFLFRKPPYSPYSDNLFICSIPVGGSCAIRFLVDELGGMSPQFMGIFSRDNADEA